MSTAPWHDVFAAWYADAVAHEPDVPDAMQLATLDSDGRPSLRTVLMKDHGPSGLTFYTNLGSRKALALGATPKATALFHWKSLQRQAIVEGDVTPVADSEADAYWSTRPRGSQLGGWASRQSQPQPSREDLLTRLEQVEARFHGVAVPRPPFWSGFRLAPHRVELWQGKPDRLHERRVWRRLGDAWVTETLDP
jgi:pyridoxamine 5'-phosphate oxidase